LALSPEAKNKGYKRHVGGGQSHRDEPEAVDVSSVAIDVFSLSPSAAERSPPLFRSEWAQSVLDTDFKESRLPSLRKRESLLKAALIAWRIRSSLANFESSATSSASVAMLSAASRLNS
jgi:hypothetical protein